MATVTLDKYSEGKTQIEIAEAMGVTQGAVSKILNSDREIRVIIKKGQPPEFQELIRPGQR